MPTVQSALFVVRTLVTWNVSAMAVYVKFVGNKVTWVC